MLRIWHAKAVALFRTSPLRYQVAHCESTLPPLRVKNTVDDRILSEARCWRPIRPARWPKADNARKSALVGDEVVVQRFSADFHQCLHMYLCIQWIIGQKRVQL